MDTWERVESALRDNGFFQIEVNPVIDDLNDVSIFWDDATIRGNVETVIEAINAAERENLVTLIAECESRSLRIE